MTYTCLDFKLTKALPGNIAYIPIHEPRDKALKQLEARYPWMDGMVVYYHTPTGTLFVPASWEGKK